MINGDLASSGAAQGVALLRMGRQGLVDRLLAALAYRAVANAAFVELRPIQTKPDLDTYSVLAWLWREPNNH